MACQREGNAQNQNCESGKAPEEPVALLQAAKACKGHWVNKFGHWPVGIALLPVLCFPSPQSNLGLQKLTNRAIMQVASIDCELGEASLQRVFPPNGSQFYACRAPPSVAEGGGAPWFGRPHKSSTRTKKRWCLVLRYLFEPLLFIIFTILEKVNGFSPK